MALEKSIPVTMDVCSLYTTLVIIYAIKCVLEFLMEYHLTSQMLSNASFPELLKIVPNCNNFQLNGESFIQVGVIKIKAKVVPSLGNVFRSNLEVEFIIILKNNQ